MNATFLIGRITKEPELKISTSGVSILNFTLAVNRDIKKEDGTYDADFIQCVAYRNTADFMSKYIKKGNLLGIKGRIQTGSYQTEAGEKRYTTQVVVDRVTSLQSKKEETKDELEDFNNDVELVADEDLPF